jgi:hypothetical protein
MRDSQSPNRMGAAIQFGVVEQLIDGRNREPLNERKCCTGFRPMQPDA